MERMPIRYITQSNIFAVFIFVIISSCSKSQKGNDLIVINKTDYALIGEKYCVKIYPKNRNVEIKKAYIQCEKKEVDVTDYKIIGCSKQLLVKNDTISIFFAPKLSGKKIFEKISLVLIYEKTPIILDTTFYYFVK